MTKQPRKIILKPRKAATLQRRGVLRGKPLRPSITIAERYSSELQALIVRMARDTRRAYADMYGEFGMDASIASQARIISNKLAKRFESLFTRKATELAWRMVEQTDKNSASSLKTSLKELSGRATIVTNFSTAGVEDVVKASVAANVELIKRIPEKFLADVQGQVMRSIQGGQGLKDLLPFLEEKYEQQKRHAKNVALDQTRKAYVAINKARMDRVGIKKFEWLHSGGSQHPRVYHRDVLDGQIFNIDDPPIINPDTGQRGLPGDEINCRCTMRPIIELSEENDDAA